MSAQSVLVEERSAAHWEEEFRRKARISCQAMRVHTALWPRVRKAPALVVYSYISHRLLKWMAPFTLAFALIFVMAGLSLQFGPVWPFSAAAALLILLLLGARINLPFCRFAVTALVSLCGVAWGQIEAVLSLQTYTTWTPAATVRNHLP